MPYTAVRRAVASADQLVQTIAVPHDHRPQRVPSFPNLERTAVVNFTTTQTIGFTAGTTTPALMVRHPAYPLWVPRPVGSASTALSVGYSGTLVSANFSAVGDVAVLPQTWADGCFTVGSATDLDVSSYPLGMTANGAQWVSGLSVSGGAPQIGFSGTGSYNLTVFYETWDGQEIQQYSTTFLWAAPNGAVAVSNAVGRWFRPLRIFATAVTTAGVISSIHCGITSGGTLYVPTNAAATFLLPLASPAEYRASSVQYASTRSTAVGALFSNVTAVMQKEGTVAAIRVPRANGAIWSNSAFANLQASVPAIERYFGPLEKGLYAFTLPDSSTEVFRDCLSDLSYNGGLLPTFALDGFEYATLIQFSDLDATAGTNLAVTLDNHLEFRCSSMLFPLGFSSISLENYHLAQMALVKMGVFFENPIHLAAISRMAMSALRSVAPIVAPYVRQAAIATGQHLLNKGMAAIGARMGAQAQMVNPQPQRKKPKPAKKKAVVKTRRSR